MIGAQTQESNEVFDECASDILVIIRNHKNCELIKISSDGLLPEVYLMKESIFLFLKDRRSTVGLTVPNNLFKTAINLGNLFSTNLTQYVIVMRDHVPNAK